MTCTPKVLFNAKMPFFLSYLLVFQMFELSLFHVFPSVTNKPKHIFTQTRGNKSSIIMSVYVFFSNMYINFYSCRVLNIIESKNSATKQVPLSVMSVCVRIQYFLSFSILRDKIRSRPGKSSNSIFFFNKEKLTAKKINCI